MSRGETKCTACGSLVRWVRAAATESSVARWRCYNADDGTEHWDRCSRLKFERVKAEGEHFERKAPTWRESGYRHHELGDKLYTIAAKPERGANYTPSCGQCDVPPWEVCACSALLRRSA